YFENVAEHIGIEQQIEIQFSLAYHERHITETPYGKCIIIGDKAERPGAGALQPSCQQHAKRLVREPTLERITNEVVFVGARKGFHQQLAHAGDLRNIALQRQPVAHLLRQSAPGPAVVEQFADPLGEVSRKRKFASHIGWYLRVLVVGARDIDVVFRERFVAHDVAAKDKRVADHESLDKSYFDLAEHAAAAPQGAGRSRTAAPGTHQAHLEHGVFDNGADVEPIALPHPRIGDAP